MKYLRWQGGATFIVLLSLILAFFYLFADSLIKKGIEKGVSIYTGAEVNVENVKLEFSPIALTVNGFQATDPEVPSQNMVAFQQAKASISIWQYLLGKVIIDDLKIKDISFSNTRATVGEVYQQSSTTNNDSAETSIIDNKLADIKDNLPDPKSLIDNSNLLTVQASKNLSNSYNEESKKLNALKNKIPNKAQLAEYQKQIKALSDIKVTSIDDINKIKQQYDILKAQFKADKAIIKEAKTALSESKNTLAEQVKALKNAPAKDWKNIEETYQLDNIDGADFAHILFGEQAREYYDTAQSVYQKLSPLLAASEAEQKVVQEVTQGRFIFFDEEAQLPELLIKNALFSINLPQGDFEIKLSNFTHQHWLIDSPTVYNVLSDNVLNSGQFSLNGELALADKKTFTATGEWTLADVLIEQAKLRESDNLSLTLKQGKLLGKGEYKLNNNDITSNNQFTLNQASYDGKANNKLSELALNAISSTENLKLNIDAEGLLKSPEWHISSPLDKALKNALTNKVNEKLANFKSKVQSGLNDKLASSLKLQKQEGAQIVDFENILNNSDNALDSLLKSDVVKQQQDKLKNKAKDKIKDKLKDKLGGFF